MDVTIFEMRVRKTATCWFWRGPKDRHGAGLVSIAAKIRPVRYVVYERYNGPIPPGFKPWSQCLHKRCINPGHLVLVPYLRNPHLVSVYGGMITRCCNPNALCYPRYGGRGVRVCNTWQRSYRAFEQWALTNGYQSGLQLDRKENSKGYNPGNCKWSTPVEQQRNTRRSLRLLAFGVTKTLAEWVEDPRCTVTYHAVYRRLKRNWPVERALCESQHYPTTPERST